jgi:hypothetical protein
MVELTQIEIILLLFSWEEYFKNNTDLEVYTRIKEKLIELRKEAKK